MINLKEKDENVSKREEIIRLLLTICLPPIFSESDNGFTLKEISSQIDLSPTATRYYLEELVGQDILKKEEVRRKIGRPTNIYFLSEKAFELFPKLYRKLNIDLLRLIRKRFGQTELRSILMDIGMDQANEMKKEIERETGMNYSDLSHEQRIEFYIQTSSQLGAYAQLIRRDNKEYLLDLNCLLYEVSKIEPVTCAIHTTILSELFGDVLKREKCICKGDTCCAFSFKLQTSTD